jgi:hypothetical protein
MLGSFLAGKRRFLAVFAAVVLGALALLGVAYADSGPSANGHANLLIAGEEQTFSFHVRTMPDGTVEGTFQVKSRGQDITAHGVLDCLRVVGNTAHVSGVVTNSKEPIFGGATFVLFTIVDNGEGEGAPPDLWSDIFLFFAPASCNLFGLPPVLPVEEGNFQVKP